MAEKMYKYLDIMDMIPDSLSRWNDPTLLKIWAEELVHFKE